MISSVLECLKVLLPFTSIKCTTIGIGIFYEKSEINIVSKPSELSPRHESIVQ